MALAWVPGSAVVSRSALRVDAGEASIERRRFQPSPPIRGVRACLRCCCPTPGPEVYRDGCRPLFPSQANKGSCRLPLGRSGPAVLLRRRGRAASDFRCPRELDVLLLCVGSGRTPGRVNGPPRFPRKATGGRAPSITVGSGHPALERSLEMMRGACLAAGTAGSATSRPQTGACPSA